MILRKSVFILLIFLISSTGFTEVKRLKFGIFPTTSSKTTVRLFSPLAQKISESIGIPVDVVSAPNRKQFQQKTIAGAYDIIWTCNACYLKAREKIDIMVIARGGPAFHGVVLVRKDSNIHSIVDLKGKTVGATSPTSLAGYLFLRNQLLEKGIDAQNDVHFKFLEQSVSLPFKVYNKTFDAGVFSEMTYFRSKLFDKIRTDLKVISRSIEIPQFPFLVKSSMDKSVSDKIATVLTGIGKGNMYELEILRELKLEGIERATGSDYDEFEEMYLKIKNYTKSNEK